MSTIFLEKRQYFRQSTTQRYGLSLDDYDGFTRLIATEVSPVSFRKGEFIQQTGDRERQFYWLTSGVGRRGYFSEDGEDVTLGFVMEAEGIGSHSDILANRAGLEAKEFMVAETAIQAYRLPWQTIVRLRQEHPFVNEYYVHAMEWNIRRIAANLHIRSIPSATLRLEAFRAAYPGLEDRITQRALASFLGITTQYMSRLRRMAA